MAIAKVASRPCVLIVDDDEIALIAIADLIREEGFEVRCLTSPVGAADMAEADENVAAVVLDLNMPIMRGDNVARVFLSRPGVRNIPLVLLSADTQQVLERVHRRMPNVEALSKANMHDTLGPAVRRAIQARPRHAQRASKWG